MMIRNCTNLKFLLCTRYLFQLLHVTSTVFWETSGFTDTVEILFQYVLQEHNYVALPPASPPLSPMLHHNAGGKLNGAQSSASPSSLNSDPLSQHHAPYHGQLAPHNQLSKSKCNALWEPVTTPFMLKELLLSLYLFRHWSINNASVSSCSS